MSYLLKKLKDWQGKKPEEIKTLLYREGFASNKMDFYYEVKEYYMQRLSYYQRQRISNPKGQANYETRSTFNISEKQVRNCVDMSFD